MRTIQILQIIGSMNMGGAENFIINIFKNIDREKVTFDFLVNRPGIFDNQLKTMGANIYYLPALQKVGAIIYKKNLREFFRNHKEYKIVHSHLNQVSGIILECAKEENIPIRISHSHSSSNFKNNFLERIYKNYLNTKINKNATDFFACSKTAAKWLFKEKANKAIIIRNAIDIDKFSHNISKRKEIREKLNIKEDEVIIGHVGRMNKVKNHKFLIDIFYEHQKHNQNSKLLLLGDGPLRGKIEKKVKKLNIIDKVLILGDQNDIEDYYNAMDIFIFPSFYEGLPLTVIEAQINGLNCIISDKISEEVNVSKKIKMLSINENPSVWAKEINNLKFKRYDAIEQIRKTGYDLKEETKKIENKYIELYDYIIN